jgi:hypothetical protein
MNFPIFLVVGAALCLGAVILAAFLIILTLQRGSRAISQGVQKTEEGSQPPQPASADTRWAQGDLKGEQSSPTMDITLDPCPACGGENPRGAGVCRFCGRNL